MDTLLEHSKGWSITTLITLEIHNLANRKTSACTSDGIFYNWLEVDGSKIPSTKTIDSSFAPGVYYKISKEADGMGLY